MKKVFQCFSKLRIVVLFLLVAVVVAVSFGGRKTDTLPVSTAATGEPGWITYFGNTNPGNYVNENHLTVGDHNNEPGRYNCSSFAFSGGDPFFRVKKAVTEPIAATTNKIALVRYRTSSGNTNKNGMLQLFFGASGASYSTTPTALNCDNEWHDVVINMSNYSGWTGSIAFLRVDFEGFAVNDTVYLSFIAFFDTEYHAETWHNTYKSSDSLYMGTVRTQTGTRPKEITQVNVYFGGANGADSATDTSPRIVDGQLNKIIAPGSGDFKDWQCIYCEYKDGRYHILDLKMYDSTIGGSGLTVEKWLTNYSGGIVIATKNPAGNAGTAQDFSKIWNYVNQDNYIKISGTTLTVYQVSATETEPVYADIDVYAPAAVSIDGLTPDVPVFLTGTVRVDGGSTSTNDYTSAGMRRFYRSNLNGYLLFNGYSTEMRFYYEDVSVRQETTLNGLKGIAVAKLGVFNSGDGAYQNNKENAIQFTYLPAGGDGYVIFQDGNLKSAGAYYDQDVDWEGYDAEDVEDSPNVVKGCDKYTYSGNFAHHVLPAGTYEARLQYEILFDKYVIVQGQGYTNSDDSFDGINMRMWPGAIANRDKNTETPISDSDSLITSIPIGVNIYVGYDSSDISTADWYSSPTEKGGVIPLNGGVFYSKNASDGSVITPDHVWRRACCVINGVFYEGWIDTSLTNYTTKVADTANIKSTMSASADDLFMIPRKAINVDQSLTYGRWEVTTHDVAESEEFAVRWSWSFNDETNVSTFTDGQDMLFGAQSEFNTNNFWTITSTGESTGTTGTTADGSTTIFGFGHTFTHSVTHTSSTATVPPTNYGLCKVNYVDPLNKDNANANYLAILYRTQDSYFAKEYAGQSGKDKMAISIIDGANPENMGYLYKEITCDGNWNTVIFDLTDETSKAQASDQHIDMGWSWTRDTMDGDQPSTTDGIRPGEMTAVQIFPFGYGGVVGGKSMDFAMIGLFTSEAEANAYITNYKTVNLSAQKGAVRVINTSNGTVTLTKGGSGSISSDNKLLTNVSAGSTYTVNVTPSSGYYCSKLCWRPTGYLLKGGSVKISGVANWDPYSVSEKNYNTYTAADNAANVIEYVDMLDTNYINNNLFTGGNTASGWTKSTWGEKEIMTQEQIQAYNHKLVSSYASSTRNDQPVNILEVYQNTMTVAKIQTYIDNMCTSADATAWGLSAAYTNRNYSAISASYVKYGVVTARTNIRNLPTATTHMNSDNHDDVQETGIAYGTPVWVLHVSTDGAYYFVQSYNYRGWVASSAVATTTSYKDWIEFADPDIRGDIVVTTASSVTINGQTAEMGVAFQHVSTSGSTYTIKVPTRGTNGDLGSANATVTSDYANLGYLPYTWNNYVTQLFKYIGTIYSWGDADVGRVDCSSLAVTVLKTFGFKIMRNSSQQALCGYTNIVNDVSYSYPTVGYTELAKFSGAPVILSGGGHTALYLGMSDGKHYIIHAPRVNDPVTVEVLNEESLAKWNSISVMAPQNYLEEAALRSKVTATGATFSVSLETPAYETYNASTKATLNDGVNAYEGSLIDMGDDYADEFILNAGGRDVYVYAEFKKIESEIAVDVELQIPDGFGLGYNVYFGGFTHTTALQDEAGVEENYSGVIMDSRLMVYKGYKLIEMKSPVQMLLQPPVFRHLMPIITVP